MKICLVEDEKYTLKGLCQKIIDLGSGHEIVGTAYNGLDALDVIREHRPDVVMTDIRMPDMDGIALAAHLREHWPNIATIIISGYQDFEYAKTALRLGVRDYLLKPVDTGELKDCLARCEEAVAEIRNAAHIGDILANGAPIHWGDQDYCLIYMIFGNAVAAGMGSMIHPGGIYIPSQKVEQAFQPLTMGKAHLFCFIGAYSNEKVVMVPREKHSDPTLAQKLADIAAACEQLYQYPVTIAYRPMDKSAVIGDQIKLCRKIALQNILMGTSNVVSGILADRYTTGDTNDLIAYLGLCLRRGQPGPLRDRVKQLFTQWHSHKRPARAIQNDLIYMTNALKSSLVVTEPLEYTIADYVDEVVSISGSYGELAGNYCDLLMNLFVPAGDGSRSLLPTQLVERIERYFRSNLANDVTLAMLCEEMNYSKVYLCRVFKNMTDTSPIDYFIQMKIEKAKLLFSECPAMSVKDVADSLGFSDSYYFSRVFKRITGLTPTAAREEARKKQGGGSS